jgi:hypothetical protein
VARKEGCNNTWINYFPVYIRDYGSADSVQANELTSDDCWNVPDDVKCAPPLLGRPWLRLLRGRSLCSCFESPRMLLRVCNGFLFRP